LKFSWYFNGKILVNNSKYLKYHSNGSLEIPNFKKKNAGIYICNALNSDKLLPAKLDDLGRVLNLNNFTTI